MHYHIEKTLCKTHIEQITKIIELLGGTDKVKIVGGAIRNLILGISIEDIDLATTLMPDEVRNILLRNNIKCLNMGINYGTIVAVVKPNSYDITTLRKDVNCFGRRAEIALSSDWMEDAARRDFTVNAMFMDLDGAIIDYFGGYNDVLLKRIRFIGDPKQRIREDWLRIIRYIRMHTYVGVSNIDMDTLQLCSEMASGIETLSGERVYAELIKLLSGRFTSDTIKLLFATRIPQYMGFQNIDTGLINTLQWAANPLTNLALLIDCTGQDVAHYKHIWNMSNKVYDIIACLMTCTRIEYHDKYDNKWHQQQIFELGLEKYLIYIQFNAMRYGYTCTEHIQYAKNFIIPSFPVTCKDLMQLGMPNRLLSSSLNELKRLWVKSHFTLSKEELLCTITVS